MNKLRKVFSLHHEGKSKRFISDFLRLSRNTVKKYINRFVATQLSLEVLEELSDTELEAILVKDQNKPITPREEALYTYFKYAEKELKKTGVTRFQLWYEYYQ